MKLSEIYPKHPPEGITVGTRLRRTEGCYRNEVYIVARCSLDPLTVGLVCLADGNLWCRPVEMPKPWVRYHPIPRDIVFRLIDINGAEIADLDNWEVLPSEE